MLHYFCVYLNIMDKFYNIYKNEQYSQNRIDDYVLWVKKIGLLTYKNNPPIYAVSNKTEINTPDGPMLSVKVCNDIANPNLEPIAEIVINNNVYYILDEYLYAVGTRSKLNAFSNPCCHVRTAPPYDLEQARHIHLEHPDSGNWFALESNVSSCKPIDQARKQAAKRKDHRMSDWRWVLKMVIYKIGTDPIF